MAHVLTKSAFAKKLGVKPSYVTLLALSDRLVMARDGRRVNVAASIKRIKESEDPNRDDVRRRHQQARLKKAQTPSGQTPPAAPEDPEVKRVSRSFTAARADKEHYQALAAKLEYERAIGKVVETTEVQHAGAGAGAAVRALLENFPDQTAPLIANKDEEEVRRILDDRMEVILGELADKFATLAVEMTSRAGAE